MFLLLPLCCHAAADGGCEQVHHAIDMGNIALLRQDMGRTSAFFADQVISPNKAKGVLGESYAQSAYTKAHPRAITLTPRTGPQGLDHVFIETNPKTGGIMVVTGESKVNTSRLGMTIDGRQMSPKWTSRRLDGLGKRYQACADPSKVEATRQRMPLDCKHSVDVPLPSGRHVHFFKVPNREGLLFTGTRQELGQACAAAQKYGRILRDAASGAIPTAGLLFHTDTNAHVLKTYSISPGGKEQIGSINLKDLRNAAAPKDFREALAKELRKAHPWLSDKAARTQANGLAKDRSLRDFVAGKKGGIALKGARFGALSLLFHGTASCISEGEISLGSLTNQDNLVRATLTTAGASMDYALPRILLKTNIGTKMIMRGTSGAVARNLGKNFGRTAGTATILLFAAYDIFRYQNGFITNRELSANLMSTGAGAIAGSVASAGVASLVAMYGAASTGTAIASLSGAAATNATLAYLGGGSIAAGGFGMTGGAVVLGGVAAAAFIAVGWGVYKCVELYYEAQDTKDLGTEINVTKQQPSLRIFSTP